MPTRNVVLTDHQQEVIESLVSSGRYQNASEVLRDGLRLVEQREAEDAAKLEALGQAAAIGWRNLDAGRRASLLARRFTTAYDAADNPVQVVHPDGQQETFAYDALNRMTSAALNGTTVATLTYDVLSRRTGLTFGDGSSQTYGYDGADRLTSLAHSFPNGTSANVTFTYGYDGAGRLTSNSISNPAFADVPPPTVTAYGTANTLNQYPTVAGVSQTYRADGALQQVGSVQYWTDEKRQFDEAVNSSTGLWRVESLDALGGRWASQHSHADGTIDETGFVDDGVRPEPRADIGYLFSANYASVTTIGWRDYVLGPNPDERLAYSDTNGTIYYPHVDRQGTTIALATGGQDVLTRTYGPYGETRQATNALAPGASAYPYLYTGQHYDPAFDGGCGTGGLYYYKARIYDPVCGRFMQPDPIGPKDDINLYTYTGNDPVNGTDPLGLAASRLSNDEYTSCGFPCEGAPADGQDELRKKRVLQEEQQVEQQRLQAALRSSDAAKCQGNKTCEDAVFQAELNTHAGTDRVVSGIVGFAFFGPLFGPALGAEAADGAAAETAASKVCCFVAGTLVDTNNGLRPIETIAVGDLVFSRDPVTGATALKPVSGLIRRHDREIYVVTLAVPSPSNGEHIATFKTTDDHPWRATSGEWLHTVELKPGVHLQRAEGRPARVMSVVNSGKTAPTFNLEVADFHTYFVGEDKIWVHNACPFLDKVAGLRNTETIARGRGIRDVGRLVRTYGGRADQWRKMKGVGELEGRTGEFHWYQNDALGRFEGKLKSWLDW